MVDLTKGITQIRIILLYRLLSLDFNFKKSKFTNTFNRFYEFQTTTFLY
jgi:hypothetical protein